jgi:uncharacterized Zn finger protein (UPF0148 family)
MKLYHCKKCGTFIGSYGCDELCPTCRRKETYLTKEEVAAMLTELQLEIEELDSRAGYNGDGMATFSTDYIRKKKVNELIQQKINKLKEEKEMSIMKYTKKPVVIEALQIHGNVSEIKEFIGNNGDAYIDDAAYQAGVHPPVTVVIIHTLEGDMRATDGDYIIKGVKGEFYPCRKDIFEETYEKIDKLKGNENGNE